MIVATSSPLALSNLILIVGDRLWWGCTTLPTLTDWLTGIVLILVYALIALPLGFWFKFLQFDNQFTSPSAIKIITTSLISPAILEELFFRVILLPHLAENLAIKNILIWSIISLSLFVIYHPLNAIIFFSSERKTFFNPIFLWLAAGLGIICTISYLQSGSIYVAVIIHWLAVIIWLLYLGGIKQLSYL